MTKLQIAGRKENQPLTRVAVAQTYFKKYSSNLKYI